MKDFIQKLYGQPASELPAATPAVVQEALTLLPPPYQQALTLHYIQGLSREATASQLHCTASTVQRTLTRGISLLKQQLHLAPEPAAQVLRNQLSEKLPQPTTALTTSD